LNPSPRAHGVRYPRGSCHFGTYRPSIRPLFRPTRGIQHPASLRVCYKAKPARKQPKHAKRTGVFLDNQFGTEQLDTVKEDELCVPSSTPAP
jgi:hypothetical protein